MLGVVLWSDPKDGKAVFWCEDQGDLAYFDKTNCPLSGAMIFDPGDMVQFDVRVGRNLRHASNAKLVKEQAYSGLPEKLRQSSADAKQVRNSANVIQFAGSDPVETHVPVKSMRKA